MTEDIDRPQPKSDGKAPEHNRDERVKRLQSEAHKPVHSEALEQVTLDKSPYHPRVGAWSEPEPLSGQCEPGAETPASELPATVDYEPEPWELVARKIPGPPAVVYRWPFGPR